MTDIGLDAPAENAVAKGALLALAERVENGVQYCAKLEEQLKQSKALLRQLQEVELPNAMVSQGVQSIALPSGNAIVLNNIVSASIPEHRQAEAMQWLIAHGHDDIIKHELTILFDKGHHDNAEALKSYLEGRGYTVEYETKVHGSTLKAWAKRVVPTSPAGIPLDLLGVFVGNRADLVVKTSE